MRQEKQRGASRRALMGQVSESEFYSKCDEKSLRASHW